MIGWAGLLPKRVDGKASHIICIEMFMRIALGVTATLGSRLELVKMG